MNIFQINANHLLHRLGRPLLQSFQVLVFSKTVAYRHESIPAGVRAFRLLAERSISTSTPFTVTATEDAEAVFATPESLARFRVIILLQCSGNFLTAAQLDNLKAWVRKGGGVVGVHCASFGIDDAVIDPTGWYKQLIGAHFKNHPIPQSGVVRAADPGHAIMSRGAGMKAFKDGSWTCFDEWYNFHEPPSGVGVLLTVDETTYSGGEHGEDHPIAWCREFDGGRTYYNSLGHFDEAYEDETLMGQLLNGILWAAG
jgi:type 1 glutamine amidotransferase